MTAVLRFIGLLALQLLIVAALLMTGLYLFQTRLIYPGARSATHAPAGSGFHTYPTAHGAVHHRPGRADAPVVLMMHGNGGGLSDGIAATRAFSEAGYEIAIVGYPGYDGTPGTPSEPSIVQASKDAYDWIAARHGSTGRIYVIGNSIGGGPAVAVSGARPVSGLVLVSAFADLPGVVRRALPIVPKALVRDRYDNAAGIARVKAPILLMHAADDDVVPAGDMMLLSRASTHRPTTRLLSKGGHQIMFSRPVQRMIYGWMTSEAEARR